jgi:hypothetical protein
MWGAIVPETSSFSEGWPLPTAKVATLRVVGWVASQASTFLSAADL